MKNVTNLQLYQRTKSLVNQNFKTASIRSVASSESPILDEYVRTAVGNAVKAVANARNKGLWPIHIVPVLCNAPVYQHSLFYAARRVVLRPVEGVPRFGVGSRRLDGSEKRTFAMSATPINLYQTQTYHRQLSSFEMNTVSNAGIWEEH